MSETFTPFEFPITGNDKWYVCHGQGSVLCVKVPAGSGGTTGQPSVEGFDTPAEAYGRAKSLGWQPPRMSKASVTAIGPNSPGVTFDTSNESFYSLSVGDEVVFTRPGNLLPAGTKCLSRDEATGFTLWSSNVQLNQEDLKDFTIYWGHQITAG
jgi:hypothetical protein